MKKILILCFAVIFMNIPAFAANYDAAFKQTFYDGFLGGMFYSLEQRLLMSGYPQPKVKSYSTALKSKVNRQQLETATWACVSKYSVEQLSSQQQKIADECFGKWVNDFFTRNQSLTKMLQ